IVIDVVDDDDRSELASAALAEDAEAATGDSTMAVPMGAPTDVDEHERSVAPAAAPEAHSGSDAETDAPKARRFTLRVALFLVLLLAVVAAGAYATVYYARSSYFVGLKGDRVTIFQ